MANKNIKFERTTPEEIESRFVLSNPDRATCAEAKQRRSEVVAHVLHTPFGNYLMALELADAENANVQNN